MTGKSSAGPTYRIDRRVGRTRAALQQALISLIRRSGYDSITIEQICNHANVGRSTFYAHFTGKDDLKRSGFDDHLRAMLVEQQRCALAVGIAPGSFAFARGLFEHAGQHVDLYRALVGTRGSAVMFRSLREIVSELVRNELGPPAGAVDDPEARELAVQFLVGALLSMLTSWLDGGAKLPVERVESAFRRLATEGWPAAPRGRAIAGPA